MIPDTWYSAVDPVAVLKKYANRIKHVHLKDIRKVLDRVSKSTHGFLQAVRAGVFTVPGDGMIDYDPPSIDSKTSYSGWFVVEAEQDPAKANPLNMQLRQENSLLKQVYKK